jgi:glycosyltransferase involved in cell wall biosynthesis
MRIVEVCEPLREGVGRHVTDISVGLSERGHDVHVVYSPHRSDGALVERLTLTKRISVVPIPMRREPSLSDIGALFAIKRYIARHGPFDIVHGHSSKAGVLARLACAIGTSRVIYTPHAFATMNQTSPRLKLFAYQVIERALAPIANRVICAASDEYSHARDRLKISDKRLVTLFNCIDPTTFRRESDLRTELGLEPSVPIIGFVGRLEYQKGADIAIAALPQILAAHPTAILVIIGEGIERQRLESQALSSGVNRAVRWLGVRKAREYFHNLDLLLCPSRYDGGAYTVIEGLYSGLPVVCTAVGIARDVIRDGVNGFALPSADPEAMAAAANALLSDLGLRRRISEAARRSGGYFHTARMLDELEEIYLGRLSGYRAVPAETAEL